MWAQSIQGEKNEGTTGLVAVAIDKDKGSQNALKWATDHLVANGQTVILIHVRLKGSIFSSQSGQRMQRNPEPYDSEQDQQMKELFLPFRCFCTRKDIDCKDVILEDSDVVKALIEYVSQAAIENLVLGAPRKNGFLRRFKTTDIPGDVTKGAPDFCNVFVVSKGKVSFMRSASRPAPVVSPLQNKIPNPTAKPDPPETYLHSAVSTRVPERTAMEPLGSMHHELQSIKSPFTRGKAANGKPYGDLSVPENDISIVSSGRPSISSCSDIDSPSFESLQFGGRQSLEHNSSHKLSSASHESDNNYSWSSQAYEDVEAEMRRLKLELKQTMDMYSTACKEALMAKQKATELQRWKLEEQQRLEKARMAEEVALSIAEKEKARSRAALEHAEAAKRIAELESQKRINVEKKALREAEEKKRALDALSHSNVRYRKYTIDEIETATEFFAEGRKIGEGGYGPVYKCNLDYTQVAIKVLRPDAAQGRLQFQQEVEVLSCIRHPNMVLLLGACPEYGCIVYEYMANGSLDDCLFHRGNSPSLPWQLRFRIAAEIGTGLLFLHQTKPEPLVHRDLKPGNILLDRNFVSKISDVGLARLVPSSVADAVTQYRLTSAAGTFYYIDPEYQQTGMLGIKSDIYSLGIMLLQLITANPPMGLTHHVKQAIEKGTFADMLDPSVPDWPVEEALRFANVALKCAELRRKDRPDLGKVILPELNRLRTLAEENMHPAMLGCGGDRSPTRSQIFFTQDVLSDGSNLLPSDYGSSRSLSSA